MNYKIFDVIELKSVDKAIVLEVTEGYLKVKVLKDNIEVIKISFKDIYR